jgi:hypothetical protein
MRCFCFLVVILLAAGAVSCSNNKSQEPPVLSNTIQIKQNDLDGDLQTYECRGKCYELPELLILVNECIGNDKSITSIVLNTNTKESTIIEREMIAKLNTIASKNGLAVVIQSPSGSYKGATVVEDLSFDTNQKR